MTISLVRTLLEGGRRTDIEKIVGAEMPWAWPGRALVEQAFRASLEAINADPDKRLWGDRLMITKDEPRRVVGSIVFHGRPDADGRCEIAYGVDEASQNKGYGTEALTAVLAWALEQPECRVIVAQTTKWHKASARVLEKVGMKPASPPASGEMITYELRKEP
jgi:RimJ/RimL family protein N-acetyltransferase